MGKFQFKFVFPFFSLFFLPNTGIQLSDNLNLPKKLVEHLQEVLPAYGQIQFYEVNYDSNEAFAVCKMPTIINTLKTEKLI